MRITVLLCIRSDLYVLEAHQTDSNTQNIWLCSHEGHIHSYVVGNILNMGGSSSRSLLAAKTFYSVHWPLRCAVLLDATRS